MASSMGSIMMNWTSELIKQAKKKNRRKLKEQQHQLVKELEGPSLQAKDAQCTNCKELENKILGLEQVVQEVHVADEEVREALEDTKASLASAIDREATLNTEKMLLLEKEAQIRVELEQLSQRMVEQSQLADKEHEKQVQMMEQILRDKEVSSQAKIESLQNELRNAIHTNIHHSNMADMSRAQLEQELSSLHAVIEMRTSEIRELRQVNQDLRQRLDRHHFLESELGKARQRLEEMSLVVQNKMVAEKELIDMTEALTNDLGNARNEIMSLRREIENRKYLYQQSPDDVINVSRHRNEHQKASCGGNNSGPTDPTLVLDVREKNESVAWMLHIPDSPKLSTK